MIRRIFALVLIVASAGCAQRSEVTFHLSIFRPPVPPPEVRESVGPGLQVPRDPVSVFAMLQSRQLWSRITPRLIGRIQDPERLHASLEIKNGPWIAKSDAIYADVIISARGARGDEVGFALETLVDSFGIELAREGLGRISKSK